MVTNSFGTRRLREPRRARVTALVLALTTNGAARAQASDQLQVEITGERGDRHPSSADPSAASTVIEGEALRTPGASAIDVVSSVPGVQVRRSGASSDPATISVRGASSEQLAVYVAGVRVNDEAFGSADLSTLPLWMLERVELYRGNAPEHADRLGIAGAIFFEPRLPRRSRVGAGLEIGSFGALGGWVGGEVAAADAGSLVMLRHDRADNDYPYLDDRGTRLIDDDDRIVRRRNADFRSYDVWTIGRWSLSGRGARMTALLNAYEREQGIGGIGVIPSLHARVLTRRELGALSSKLPCELLSASCRLELSSSLQQSRQLLTDPSSELDLGAERVVSFSDRFVQSGRVTEHLSERVRVTLGLSGEASRLSIARDEDRYLRALRQAWQLSLTAGFDATEDVHVHALGAFGCHSTGGPSSDRACDPFAAEGRIGVLAQLSKRISLLANLGRYLRVPSLGELYGTSPVLRGNASLDPERALSADLGVRAAESGRAGGIWLDGFVFARSVSDLIAFRRTSRGFVNPFNIGSARVVGAEIALGATLLDHVSSDLSVTLLDARDVSPGRTLENDIVPFQSRLVVAQSLEVYLDDPFEAWDVSRVAAGVSIFHRSARFADPAGLIVIPGHVELNGHVSLTLWDRGLALRGAIENVLDQAHFDLVGYPLPGRSLHASLEVWF